MKLRIAFTRLARLDLDKLIVHIGEDDPRAAIEVAARVFGKIDLLETQPEIGRRGRRPGTREFVIDGTRYIVAYRVDAARAQVQILRILHSSRRWPRRI